MAFDSIIAYEDRALIRTSRWELDGIVTKDSGNTDRGWLWFSTVQTGDNIVMTLYKDRAGTNDVAESDSVDVSDADTTPVMLTFSQANTSGISGIVWIEDFTEDVTLEPAIVSLCMDQDIEDIYARSDEAHMADVFNSTTGFARFCSVATSHVVRLITSLYMQEIGGFGAVEAFNLTSPDRLNPDWRGVVAPLQLLDAAKYYACWYIFMAADESDGSDSMLAFKATTCKELFDEAVSKISLTINTNPDEDEDADLTRSASVTRPTRT